MRGILLFVALIVVTSCGSSTEPSENPLPVLLSVEPTLVTIGSPRATVTLTGQNFVRSSQARWKEGDRATTYESQTRLRAVLTAEDLASPDIGRFTVFNGPPGGGTSGGVQFAVGYPAPSLQSISPTEALAGSSDLELTVRGSNFVSGPSQSVVRIDGESLATTYVSQSTLTATVPEASLQWGRFAQVKVVNPAPGGGPSDSLQLSVLNPVPSISALSPDSALTGYTFDLTVVGSGFGQEAVLQWNGIEQLTTFQSSAGLSATVPGTLVMGPGTAQITVFNPPPGGGTSTGATMPIYNAPPRITTLEPNSLTAGSEGLRLTIRGNGFRAESSVERNDQLIASTFVDPQKLEVTLAASDLATPGTLRFVIVNPGVGGRSLTATLPILPAIQEVTDIIEVPIPNRFIISDPVRTIVYASIPGNEPTYGNQVIALDPTDGTVVWSTHIGAQPDRMAISDDGSFLYLTVRGRDRIARVDLTRRVQDLEIPLPTDTRGTDIAVLPRHPRTIVVAFEHNDNHRGLAVFDDDRMRPRITDSSWKSPRIEASSSDLFVFGSTGSELLRFLVTPDGIQGDTRLGGVIGSDIRHDRGFLYSPGGDAVDTRSMTHLGSTATNADVCPDVANGRIHYVKLRRLRTFHHSALTEFGNTLVKELGGSRYPVRWGTDGIATGGGNFVLFFRSSIVGS